MSSAPGTCSQCGAELNPGARFCRTCGAPVETPEPAEPDQSPAIVDDAPSNPCPACHQPNGPAARFCRHCGAAMDRAAAGGGVYDPGDAADRPRRRIWPFALAIVAVLAAAGGGYFLWKYVWVDGEARPATAASPAATPAPPVATGPFSSVEFLRVARDTQVYVGQLNPEVRPAEILAAVRAHCLENQLERCGLALVRPGGALPTDQLRTVEMGEEFESMMQDLMIRRIVVGVYFRTDSQEELELNCDLYSIPAEESAIKCLRLPDESALDDAEAAADAAADAVEDVLEAEPTE